MKTGTIAVLASVIVLGGCASGPPKLPYPAFLQVDTLEDIFMASMPGVRAKQLAGDPQTRRSSNRVNLPTDWKGTSGGAPGRSMEIFVLHGELTIADIALRSGGYAFLPAGSLGFNLVAAEGAQILYFVNDADPESVIRSPIIIDSALLSWEGTAVDGIDIKTLRDDPGNGAKTWMARVSPLAVQSWQSSSTVREGYLMNGDYQHSECMNGEIHTWQYTSGGYFLRPGSVINGGPESAASTTSVWFMREMEKGETNVWPDCVVQEAAQP